MNVSGIAAHSSPLVLPRQDRDVNARDDARPSVPAPAASPPAASARAIARGPQSTVPVAAPPGTDPELWSVLTSAEREFFARSAAQGPLTYNRASAGQQQATPPAITARGGRVDVRV